MGMTAPRLFALLCAFAALAGCKSTPVADLALNPELYAYTDYVCKAPGDRTVFVAPVTDARTDVSVADEVNVGGFPVSYDVDGRWHRPVVEMVDEILRHEIEESEIFDEVVASPAKAQILVVPTLVSFRTGAVEEMSGGRAVAEVSMRIEVHGPADANGNRKLMFEQAFVDRKVTEASFRTASRYVLAGVSLRAVVLRMLQTIDSKNVAREGMPMPVQTGTPAEASLRR